ncbi:MULTISPECIES: hypothetical protein [unclassified Cryobacterium]|uniref:hypothetical protein n=1 Tax=unclassified Cryobacterium TaxID=2649013 RepID=UPI001068DA0D|nr:MULTISPECIES: hypothetical protein [unclassified Cryobacterium]TFC59434.1 hypothetical protein E3O68_00610 [Cryobacterium sp. TMB3-1-2]TFC67230.1 hypothetical protein E3T21_17305 [Cryobacterium sp. TMB3-15]TFC73257.1 hypothetical protein E3T22_16750 [Cryobacterium sp. TMB3-10]TFD46145.1 hypothetical protein E3T58_01385 [Cryobacterium sp. TMB3-12]
MDERVSLTRKLNGASEIRISESDLADLGRAGLARELTARGFDPDHLGEPKYDRYRMRWTIPVRTPDE